jgi:ParB family chromosome partitioning protein
MKAKRLGRGLSGLLHRTDEVQGLVPPAAPTTTPPTQAAPDAARRIPIAALRPNPYQPRTAFREEALDELKESIRVHGILQPLVVRRSPTGFEVVAGERRLRAAQALGWLDVPAVVRDASDEEMQTLALVENLQREDLNALEQARSLRAMMANFGLTQEDVAQRVGKARTTIANIVRLLDLPPEVQKLVEDGALSGAHARAMLAVKGEERRILLARTCVQEGLSVREVERRAALAAGPGASGFARKRDPFLADLEERLRRALSAEVSLAARGKGGEIRIRYRDPGELDRLLELFRA